jgi:hypothetical protein
MRQHHTKVHDDPLPNRTCKGCGTEFYDEKARLEFCDDCNPEASEHNGNWKDAKESANCRICSAEFEYYPSNKDGVYCPPCVEASEEFLGTPSYEVWDVQRVERSCNQCGDEFVVLKSKAERGYGKFCDRDCLSEWLSDNWQGEDHPQWVEGKTRYAGRWWTVRRGARARDDDQCRVCGKSKEEIGREPDVHHVEPIRTFDDSQEAHRMDNVICLCRSCHRRGRRGTSSCRTLHSNHNAIAEPAATGFRSPVV